jgi:hypothetical protein
MPDNQKEKSMLPGTEQGEYAAAFYADLVVEGENQGGVVGTMKQVGGWTGGLLSSLWTSETAASTVTTLALPLVGGWAAAGRLGAASLPVLRTLQTLGSFSSGVMVGEAVTGTTITGNQMTGKERALTGALGMVGIGGLLASQLGTFGLRSSLFGRNPSGTLNSGPVRLGWSWFKPANNNFFALHGGGTFNGVNQGPHWHLRFNQHFASGPSPAPIWASLLVRGTQAALTFGSAYSGYKIADIHFMGSKEPVTVIEFTEGSTIVGTPPSK